MTDDVTEWEKDEIWCYEHLNSRIRVIPDHEIVRFCEMTAELVQLGVPTTSARVRAFKEVFG